MIRSLWTAASGMKTQQYNLDTISNNLANVNTTGYKKERMEFQSLLYETMKEAGDVEQGGAPVNFQVGHGVRVTGSTKTFTQGNIETTNKPMDFSLMGDGFFAVRMQDGTTNFTKDGSFKLSLRDDQLGLTTVNGLAVLNRAGEPITFPEGVTQDNLIVNEAGDFSYMNNSESVDLNFGFQIAQFRNREGLINGADGMLKESAASGAPIYEDQDATLEKTGVAQGTLESSNVNAAEEMIKLIVTQRAYELNSKAIQTSDDMLSQANNLKR